MEKSNEIRPVTSNACQMAMRCQKLFWHCCHGSLDWQAASTYDFWLIQEKYSILDLAKQLFPDAVSTKGVTSQTKLKKLLRSRKPISHLAFKTSETFCVVDFLIPSGESSWQIIKVSQSLQVNDLTRDDLAFEKYSLESLGFDIAETSVLHVSRFFNLGDVVIPELFFDRVEVEVDLERVEAGIKCAHEVQLMSDCPDTAIGIQCFAPEKCPMFDTCWQNMPAHNPTTLFYYPKARAINLINQGITDIKDIPDDVALNDRQRIQVEAVRSGKPHIDKDAIRKWLDLLWSAHGNAAFC